LITFFSLEGLKQKWWNMASSKNSTMDSSSQFSFTDAQHYAKYSTSP